MTNLEYEEHEPQPRPSDEVYYYNNLRTKKHSYADLFIAAQKYLCKTELYSEEELMKPADGLIIPTAAEYDADERTTVEKFLTLPLRLVMPRLDLSLTISELRPMYDDIVQGIKMVYNTPDDNQYGSFEDEQQQEDTTGDVNAKRSLAFVKQYLTRGAISPDFTAFEYVVDPCKACDVAVLKIEIANKDFFIGSSEADAISNNYKSMVSKRFSNIESLAKMSEPQP